MKLLVTAILAIMTAITANANPLGLQTVQYNRCATEDRDVSQTTVFYFEGGKEVWAKGLTNGAKPIWQINDYTSKIGVGAGSMKFGPSVEFQNGGKPAYGLMTGQSIPLGKKLTYKANWGLLRGTKGFRLENGNSRIVAKVGKADVGIALGFSTCEGTKASTLVGLHYEQPLSKQYTFRLRVGEYISGRNNGRNEIKFDWFTNF